MIDENKTDTAETEVLEQASADADTGSGNQAELDRLAELERELEEVRQHILYAQAETQNVRKRMETEKVNAASYAATAFARDMLSVKDNMERALSAIPEDLRADERMKGLLTGIEATGRELDSVFSRHGISRVHAVGVKLDPNRHQAMMEMSSADAEPGTIVQELQPGYMLKDRLLRPALVGVAKKPE